MAEETSRRPSRVILALGAVAIVAVVLLLFLVPMGGLNTGGTSTTVGGHPLLGQPAPEIDLTTLDGDEVRLSELRGRPVLVNFWATWCLPCRDEFPLMAEAYEAHADDGLEILGIVHDDTASGAREFAAEMSATWPLLIDPDDVAWQDYTGVAMPTSFFIDRDGIVRAFSLGGFTQSGLTAQLGKILPQGAEDPPGPRASSGTAGSPG